MSIHAPVSPRPQVRRPHRVAPARALLMPALLATASCGGELSGPEVSTTLSNGTEVRYRAGRSLELARGGEVLLAFDPDDALRGVRYDESYAEVWGFYSFDRTNLLERSLSRLRSTETDGDQVVLTFEEPEGTATATVTISPDGTDGTRVRVEVAGMDGLDAVSLRTRCDAQSAYLGFGAQTNALDQRGEAFPLFVSEQGIGRQGYFLANGDEHTSYFPMPYYLDPRGFGVVLDTFARVEVDLCATEPDVAAFRVEDDAPVELRLLHGPTPRDVVRQLGDRYGRPQAPPSWAYQPWIGIQGGQQAVLDEADALDAAGVPWSVLWAQDWTGFQAFGTFDDIQYHWNVDPTLYPDLRGLTDTLHTRGKRFLGYMNGFVEQGREHWAEMDTMGLLAKNASGASIAFGSLKGPTGLPDLTNPAARDYVANYVERMVEVHGMDGWMCDFGEWWPIASVPFDGSDGRHEHNRHPQRWTGLHNETARALRGNDYAIFSRSGWLGSQGAVQLVWMGDQEANWDVEDGIKTVIPLMLNLGLSGVPYVTHDVAGYSGGPSTKELFQRWTELGAFTPVMRTHEGLRASENWAWDSDAETLAHFRRFARIHVALAAEFEALAAESAVSSLPILRPLALEHPDDRETVGVIDEFLVGSDLLVAPVLEPGATSREVYFPAGTWHHALRDEAPIVGPQRVVVSAPIGTPPVYSRGAARTDLRAIAP